MIITAGRWGLITSLAEQMGILLIGKRNRLEAATVADETALATMAQASSHSRFVSAAECGPGGGG